MSPPPAAPSSPLPAAYADDAISLILERRLTVERRPKILWVELTNKCNYACVMCPNAADVTQKRGFTFMSRDLFRKVVDEAASFDPFFAIFLGGESMLHPHLFEMIRYGKERGLSKIHLVTNGSMLTEKRCAETLDSNLDLLTFSFDGYDRKTFEYARIGGSFDEVTANIRRLLRMKKARGLSKPYTKIYALDLHHEGDAKFAAFFESFRDDGLNEYGVEKPGHWAGRFLGTDRFIAPENGPRFFPCHYLWKSLSILADGTVVPCCADFEGQLPIGDAHAETLLEVWNGPRLKAMRESHLAARVDRYGLCAKCDVVWHHAVDERGVPAALADPRRPVVKLNP
ncbi:MAG: SPASM domain-containing protein [Planctomycetes bacterium]|nr:SPASM domain-containing protein [Planctomycetota bacterium]